MMFYDHDGLFFRDTTRGGMIWGFCFGIYG